MAKGKFSVLLTAVMFFATVGTVSAVDEIRVGTIGPTTGWATIFGEGALQGVKLALAERDYKFNGIPIKLFSEDTKAD
ncbi:MAG: hypothetical protein ISS62_06630, partial [Desulfobacteraceae bacterium]|nr:hypothetical protein [Desulfobacteraceae bacterium]